ncbi:AAA family ATPase [Neisseria leonii]|uniref:AAA family ATPase n=1 Tax=Neisseria leonii TaxID=2995413 RepID=UPI00237B0D64|nr:AAA family ATPase [Neisseria sp. 3986]MDD9325641.1 AAA family ATPase [Neisseria sp. 3986]
MDLPLHEAFVAHYKASGLNQSQLARAVTVAPAAISMYINKKYAEHGGNIETIEAKIRDYLDWVQANSARARLHQEYVPTKTARRIHELMRDTHQDCEVGVVYGQAGLGKTVAVREYCRQNPTAVLIETNPSYTAQVLMRKIASAVKVPTDGTLNDVFEAVAERLQDSGRLLVVDEAENLPLRALELLRRLHDEAEIGLVLSGMPRLIVNLRGKRGELVQLYSRVSMTVSVGESLPDQELEQIARASLPGADDETVTALVRESGGNTRRLQKLMLGVVRTADKNQIPIQAGIVKKYSSILIR